MARGRALPDRRRAATSIAPSTPCRRSTPRAGCPRTRRSASPTCWRSSCGAARARLHRRGLRRPGETFRDDDVRRATRRPRSPMPDELRPQIPYIRQAGRGAPAARDRGARGRGRRRHRDARDAGGGRRPRDRHRHGDKDMMQLVTSGPRSTTHPRPAGRASPRCGSASASSRRSSPTSWGSWATRSTTSRASRASAQKTASALVPQLGTVETILERLDEVERCRPPRREEDPRDARAPRPTRRACRSTSPTIRRDVDVDDRLGGPPLARARRPDAPPAAHGARVHGRCCASSRRPGQPRPPTSSGARRARRARCAERSRRSPRQPAVSAFDVLDSPRATAGTLTALVLRRAGRGRRSCSPRRRIPRRWPRSRRSSATSRSRSSPTT